MTNWRCILALGFAHAVGDAISGYTVASLGAGQSFVNLGLIILVYNLVAFGLQPVAGLITDRAKGTWWATLIGMGAIGLGLSLSMINPFIGIGFIALGSAFFHVGAGAIASTATPGKSIGAAVFTAPGVMGLALGTIAALESRNVFSWLLVAAIAAVLSLIYASKDKKSSTNLRAPIPVRILPKAAFVAIVLLLIGVAIRSGVWVAFSSSSFGVNAILILGIAAGLGKLFGGIVSDAIGANIIVPVTVLTSLLCFLVPTFPLTVVGVFFLQSSTPVILTEVIKRFPRFPATGAGLILGFAILIGGVMATILSTETIRMPEVMLLMTVVAATVFSFGLAIRPDADRHSTIS